ncbi:V8-like Glu-specific endopeptidase [Shimia isoporae]|uniref:V8-like Glu-specific endopeptidase n=1 Tax=Shimia isoporae TaxID=647720 RepID=A0A4R1N454_9RHOB|nr:trypsin-like peptidase domain-containing protein [Shimia isoporae]TCL01335.1 V8-like Glu-specific endopeptidase [Shimia isoporae]
MSKFAAAILLILLGAVASAQDAALRTLATGDDGKDWGAVGRLEIDGRGFCTGALIAPNKVLTAAHCLYDRKTGVMHDVSAVEFRAGWRNGRAEAYRSVRRAAVHPDYVFGQDELMSRSRSDLAILELHHPIRNSTIEPFETAGRLRKGSKIGVVSYAVGREAAPSFQETCRVMGRYRGVYVLSCDIDFGSSGAPVFLFEDNQVRIASVVAAKAELNGQKVALAAALDFALDEVEGEFAEKTIRAPLPTVKVSPQRNNTGAKFVRPNGG